jgi:acyl carrier protein
MGEFKDVLVNFLENNLDKDIILDKINDLGIDSLNEVDYKILKQ